MKKILITGANSYIGTSFEKWVSQWPDQYSVDTIDMRDDDWRTKSFAGYDTVFHVAGIAHVNTRRMSAEQTREYYRVNRDLPEQVALHSKAQGVRQFIFLSSMSVYGLMSGIITEATVPHPLNQYGDSKLQAERAVASLSDDTFGVSIVRPPMVYGRGCKGNYQTLRRVALRSPIFLDVDNQRSMIYVDNLTEFVRLLVDDCSCGLYIPQNSEYVRTSEMLRLVAEAHGKKIRPIRHVTWAISLLCHVRGPVSGLLVKAFGSLMYDQHLGSPVNDYQLFGLVCSIIMTEQTLIPNTEISPTISDSRPF